MDSWNAAPARGAGLPSVGAGGDKTDTRKLHVEGVAWRVFEREAPVGIRHQCARCLYFDSALATRRVCDYPADWYTLDDTALYALSWRR